MQWPMYTHVQNIRALGKQKRFIGRLDSFHLKYANEDMHKIF